MDGGRSNTILINPGSTVSARSGSAVVSTFGNDTLRNAGTLLGDIDLASGNTSEWNEFYNVVGGTYVTGSTGRVRIGNARGRFTNDGTLDIGGVGKIATARVESEEVMLGGRLLVDVNSVAAAGAANADRLQASKITVNGVEIRPHAVEGLVRGSGFQFRSSSALPHRMWNLGAGLQLFKEEKYELRTEYKAQIGKDYRNQELSLRVAIPF